MGSFRLLGDLCPSLTGERAGGAGGKQRHPFSQGLCELRCLSNRGDKKHVPPLSEHSPAGNAESITGNPAAPAPQGS